MKEIVEAFGEADKKNTKYIAYKKDPDGVYVY